MSKSADNAPKVRDFEVLVRPLVTEKSSTLGSGDQSAVALEVHPKASKTEIRSAMERVFGVKVAKVRTASYLGKRKRTTGTIGRRRSWKKAYVTLAPGESIEIVEGL